MHRSKSSFLEWLVYSLIFFFLYDIIWILVDLPDFLQSVSGQYPELLVDFALCGLFSLSSLYLNRWLFKQRRFRREGQGHSVFVQNGLVVLGFNLLIAGGCELLLSLVAPKLMMQDIWGTSFLFGLIASLVALIHLSMHFSDMIVLKGRENLALQKRYLMLQLDPHFVFNSFSSLAGMIGETPKMADKSGKTKCARFEKRNVQKSGKTKRHGTLYVLHRVVSEHIYVHIRRFKHFQSLPYRLNAHCGVALAEWNGDTAVWV